MRYRNIPAFLRAHGVMVGKTEFNVAFYGLVIAGIALAVYAWPG